jgi:DmsE family decaheme c-type cytochrome
VSIANEVKEHAMHSFCKTLVRGGLAAAAAAWFATAGSASAATPRQEAVKAPPIQVPHGEYTGAETCLTCHEDHGAALKQGPHSRAFRSGSPVASFGCQKCHAQTKANLGCEACHGPGKAHADAGGDKTKIRVISQMSVADASEICSSCHFRSKHALWAGSQHQQRSVGCVTCHSVHAPKGTPLLKAANEFGLCATCHRPIVNKEMKFNHMPVREGAMTCSACHNVHGAANVRLLKAGGSITESCVTCHGEKRGPFLWEHAPVTENCTTCHDPHGTNNDRMLVAKQPFLCQRCHITSRHPPTVYEGYLLNNSSNGNKIYGRSCLICHQQVHGSNAPSGKAFLR